MSEKVKHDVALLIDDADHLYACEGKLGRALQKINRALRLEPDNTEALIIKGRILFARDRVREAMQCYEQAIAVNPRCSEALLERGRVWYAIKQDYNVALRDVEKALLYAGRDRWVKVRALCLKGNVLFALDKDREALDCFKKALKLNPKDRMANSSLGDALFAMEEPQNALPYLEKAFRLVKHEKTPSEFEIELTISSLAEAFNALGYNKRAVRLLETNLPRARGWGRQYLKSLLKQTKQLVQKGNGKIKK